MGFYNFPKSPTQCKKDSNEVNLTESCRFLCLCIYPETYAICCGGGKTRLNDVGNVELICALISDKLLEFILASQSQTILDEVDYIHIFQVAF